MSRSKPARWPIAFGALAALSCASATAPGVFVELEHRWVEAAQAHDVAVLDRLLDDTFVDTTFRGDVRTKQDVLAGPPAAGRYRSIRLDDLRVRRYGDTTVVTGVNVLQGPEPDDLVRVSFTDVFVRRDGRWRAVSAQETLQPARRDGPASPRDGHRLQDAAR